MSLPIELIFANGYWASRESFLQTFIWCLEVNSDPFEVFRPLGKLEPATKRSLFERSGFGLGFFDGRP